MLISPAYAQSLSDFTANAPQFVPLVLIFVVFYFLLIRPQQKRQKEMRKMLGALRRGDKVVTAGGIIGTISRVPAGEADKPSPEVEVEIGPNMKVMVMRDTIGSVVRQQAANDKG